MIRAASTPSNAAVRVPGSSKSVRRTSTPDAANSRAKAVEGSRVPATKPEVPTSVRRFATTCPPRCPFAPVTISMLSLSQLTHT